MALASTGSISLFQINTELGKSAPASTVSLNDAKVRGLLAVSTGAISLSNAYSKGNYWMCSSGGTGIESTRGCVVDSSDNVYICGYSNSAPTAGNTDAYLAKYDAFGVLQWQRMLGQSTGDNFQSIAIDSGNNIYCVGTYGVSSPGIFLAKYNSSGTLLFQEYLGTIGYTLYGNGVDVDSAGNVHITGYYSSGAGVGVVVFKCNSSGAIVWQKSLTLPGATPPRGISIKVDSSSNVYVCGYYLQTTYFGLLVKYNSSGVLQWQKGFPAAAPGVMLHSLDIDSVGNVVVCGADLAGTLCLIKVNSVGTIVWQRKLTGSAGSLTGTSVALDSADNAYVGGNEWNGTYYQGTLAKYNSGGTLLWQKKLVSSVGDVTCGVKIAIDSYDIPYYPMVTTTTANGVEFFPIKVPKDGTSPSTTYGNYTYTVGGYTDSVGSVPISTGGLTDATPTFTVTNAGGTNQTPAFATSRIVL